MAFGRYRGEPLSAIPTDYLDWLVTVDLRPPLRVAVERELRIREDAERERRTATGPVGPVLDPETAAVAERIIRDGYRVAAMESHPDRGGDTQEMQAVNEAIETLRSLLARVSPSRSRSRRSA